MVKLFLKIKHWQLFLVVWALPALIKVPSWISKGYASNPELTILATYLWIGVLIGWMYSIGVSLSKMLPENTKMNLKFFRICTIIPLILAVVVVVSASCTYIGIINTESSFWKADSIIFKIVFTVFFLIFAILTQFTPIAIFYNSHFCSKTLKTIELQQKIKFGKYAIEFFLILFSFIGIWFIQPRVNKIFKEML